MRDTMKLKNPLRCFLLPSLVGILGVYGIPLLISLYYAVIVDDMSGKHFIGLRGFIGTLRNPMFQRGFANTALFTVISIPILMILSLLLALLLKRLPRGQRLIAFLFMLPLVVPSGTTTYFWKCVFDANGLLNKFLYINKLPMVNWGNSRWAMVIALIMFLWKNTGFCAVLFWVGLDRIPKEYYELASSEGAGAWQKFWYVTAVYLTPTMFFVAIVSFINSFKIFKELYLLYGNYPSPHVYLLQHYMNNQFFSLNMQKLTTAAHILLLFIGCVAFALFHRQKTLSETFNQLQLGGNYTCTKWKPTCVLSYVVIGAIALWIVLPLLFTFSNSLMSSEEVINRYTSNVTANNVLDIAKNGLHFVRMGLVPDTVTMQQYKDLLLHNPTYLKLYWNSIKIVVPVVLGQCFVSCLGAYAFERVRWKYKEALFFFYVVIMLMPVQALLVPHYLVADWFGLSDSYLAIIVPGVFCPLGVFLLRQQLKGFPQECIEAAQIAGATEQQIFRRIVLPNLKPAIVALAIFTYAEYWNVVEQALVFIKSPYNEPLSVYLSRTIDDDPGLFFAASCLYLVPPLVVFLAGKNYLTDRLLPGGMAENKSSREGR